MCNIFIIVKDPVSSVLLKIFPQDSNTVTSKCLPFSEAVLEVIFCE